jgi:hypothetical protein
MIFVTGAPGTVAGGTVAPCSPRQTRENGGLRDGCVQRVTVLGELPASPGASGTFPHIPVLGNRGTYSERPNDLDL